MKSTGAVTTATLSVAGNPTPQVTPRTHNSVIEVATHLVDSVTDMLCQQITAGHLDVDDSEKPLPVLRSEVLNIESKTIDLDEHKEKIRRFQMLNKKLRRKREMRSVEMSEKSLKLREQADREREESKNKALEERRREIERRMEAKKQMLKEIAQSTLECNSKFKQVHKKKFLYMEKEEEYYNRVVLPKIQEENMILEKKKALRKPIDMTELFQHEKHYEELRINERLNRSITVRMVNDKDKSYSPPEFIPESFRRLKMEEELRKEADELRKKEIEINDIRKREYSRRLDEIRAKQRELSISPPKTERKEKEKAKPKMEREDVKNIGNQYLKELLKNNRKLSSTTRRLSPVMSPEPSKRKVRSQYEIQIVREERIEKIRMIRNRKIDQIVNDKKLDEYSRMERLKSEIEKLDEAASQKLKEKDDVETINESASIMMNSIHAKLALLGFSH